ncbi:hypothetical protein EB118_25045 [bacterium]|nr:hypothetical protein [Alphaproteobacteria bacterium]NDC95940.1 hypothetical protein [bacterium]NDD85936.1 hypothetical protein [bacterium]NDG33319.1 hypothetical protein [bacterium]
MNKGLVIGIGVLAVAGVGGYFWWKSKQNSATSSTELGGEKSASTSESDIDITDATETEIPTIQPPASKKEARQQKRQKRRDCRAEAKAQGLKGKAKRQFRRECKASGGEGFSEEADFAFNGFASFD